MRKVLIETSTERLEPDLINQCIFCLGFSSMTDAASLPDLGVECAIFCMMSLDFLRAKPEDTLIFQQKSLHETGRPICLNALS